MRNLAAALLLTPWGCGTPARAQATSLQLTNTADGNTVSATASDGPGIPLGTPRTFLWSIARDGSQLPLYDYGGSNPARPSTLIADFDADFAVPAAERTSDLTGRPWFAVIAAALARVSTKTGLTYTYLAADDGAMIGTAGAAGVRGDLRLCGGPLKNLLAWNNVPPDAAGFHLPDPVLNTQWDWSHADDLAWVLIHEHHHGLGFWHVTVGGDPSLSVVSPTYGNVAGPQFHDLIQLHRKYGDPYEKPARNDTPAGAKSLGILAPGGGLGVGSAWSGLAIGAAETDFATVSTAADLDFYQFQVSAPARVWLRLAPKGPVYTYQTEGEGAVAVDSSRFMNLRLDLVTAAGATLATSAGAAAGAAEVLGPLLLPAAGTYCAKVSAESAATSPQAYRLEILRASAVDSDADGVNDLAEFALDGDPRAAGAGGRVTRSVTGVDGVPCLVLTLAARAGAGFGGGPGLAAEVDGIRYRVEASRDLVSWNEPVVEVVPAATDGLAPASSGWAYRSFRSTGDVGTGGFLRVVVEDP